MRTCSSPYLPGSPKPTDSTADQQLQPKKLYIKIKPRTTDLRVLERQLFIYFSEFGQIDDFKILTNSGLIRTQ